MTTQGPTRADKEKAQSLIPCDCGFERGRHLMDCPQHFIAWEDVADAIAAAREQGRAEQAAHDLPAALEQEVSGNRLQAMLDRIIGDGVKQGLVRLGGADGHTLIAAPEGHILDDKGVVRRVLGTLPVTADGCVVGYGSSVWVAPGVISQDAWCHESPSISEHSGHGLLCHIRDLDGFASFSDECYSTREAALAARGNT